MNYESRYEKKKIEVEDESNTLDFIIEIFSLCLKLKLNIENKNEGEKSSLM